jgi:hypothetical protein
MKEVIGNLQTLNVTPKVKGRLYKGVNSDAIVLCTEDSKSIGFSGTILDKGLGEFGHEVGLHSSNFASDMFMEYNAPITVSPKPQFTELTMDEIASKFNIPVSQLKIKK